MSAIRNVVTIEAPQEPGLGIGLVTLSCGHRTIYSVHMRVGKGWPCRECDEAQERRVRDDHHRQQGEQRRRRW